MEIAFIFDTNIKQITQYYKKLNTRLLKNSITEFDFFEKNYTGHGLYLTKEIINKKYTHIVSVGGDFLLNEIVNGIALNNSDIILCVLPLNISSNFAENFGITDDIDTFIMTLKYGVVKKTEIGICSFTTDEEIKLKKYFLTNVNIGLLGYIAKKTDKNLKYFGTKLNLITSIAESIVFYKKPRIYCISDEFNWIGYLLNLSILNKNHIENENKSFEITIFGNIKLIYAFYIDKIKKLKNAKHEELIIKQTDKIEIEGKSYISIDNEFVGFSPAEITKAETKINVLFKE